MNQVFTPFEAPDLESSVDYRDELKAIAVAYDSGDSDGPASIVCNDVLGELDTMSAESRYELLSQTHRHINIIIFTISHGRTDSDDTIHIKTLIESSNIALGPESEDLICELLRYGTASSKAAFFETKLRNRNWQYQDSLESEFWHAKLIGRQSVNDFVPGLYAYLIYAELYRKKVMAEAATIYEAVAGSEQMDEIVEILTDVCFIKSKNFKPKPGYKNVTQIRIYLFEPLNPNRFDLDEARRRLTEIKAKFPGLF